MPRRRVQDQNHGLDQALDNSSSASAGCVEPGRRSSCTCRFATFIARSGPCSGRRSPDYGASGLPEDRITVNFTGSAGQSFGAFLPKASRSVSRQRRQRRVRQRAVGRQARGAAADRRDLSGGREHHHRQRIALRRHQRRGLCLWRRGSGSPSATAAPSWSRAWATTDASKMTEDGSSCSADRAEFAAGMSGGLA